MPSRSARFLCRPLSVLLSLAVSCTAAFRHLDAQIERATDAPAARTVTEARELFHLRDGFRVELVACEPLIADPTAIAWDEDGRLFVCELHGYNLEGHLDILELNKTGVLDREVRRIPARPEAIAAARAQQFGTVKLLEDVDGDGRMDRSRTIADHLPPCYGVIAARGGVIVTCAPDIVFLADLSGDGKFETRETLFTGFTTGVLERGINNPRQGLDGWIWAARGHGGIVRGPRLEGEVDLGHADFRFLADGSAIEPVTGANGTFGNAFTEFGERFILDTSNHAKYAVPLSWRALQRNPWVPGPAAIANAADYQRIFPTSGPHPWRLKRSQDPAWVRFYGTHETTPSGLFTSACGQEIYRAADFPPEYHGNHFACDPQNNLVHRSVLERDGAGFRARRAAGEETREFLTSDDKWFRPINLRVGPDGALWIVDMYRAIIEDYSAIPRFLQQQYPLLDGSDHGRIWRVVYEGAPKRNRAPPSRESTANLVALLRDPNAWWRETAQRLLVERKDRAAVAPLRELARTGGLPAGRVHALYTLEGLGALVAGDVEAALADKSYGVRLHALRLAARLARMDASLRETIIDHAVDPDPRVRLEAAVTLGDVPGDRATAALARLAIDHGDERWLDAAIASSATSRAAEILDRVLSSEEHERARGLLSDLGATAAGDGDPERIERLLALTLDADRRGARGSTDAAAILSGLARGSVRRRDGVPRVDRAIPEPLVSLLESTDATVREQAFAIAGTLGFADSPSVEAVFERAARDSLDGELALGARERAVRLLANAGFDRLAPTAVEILGPSQPISLQIAAIDALDASRDPGAGEVLLRAFETLSPAARSRVLPAVLADERRTLALLDAIEAGRVPASSLPRLHRLRLLEHGDPDVRERSRAALAATTGELEKREERLSLYREALAGERDLERGEALFREHCLRCHVARNEGASVGPDLASERERADETLLRDILFPSDEIATGYEAYVATTVDGRVASGILASESATSVTLREADAREHVILRRELAAFTSAPASLMPDNFAELLSPTDAANVIAWLRSAFGEELPDRIRLFDDEEELVRALEKGDGTVRLVRDDAFSGEACLSVTPKQRYSERIPGWAFPIRERPEPGEYRWLRLAWKTRGGAGILVELAADGGWPKAENSERRYYAGENTTGWNAHRLAASAPVEWTIVTIDLWRDNGSFTLTGIAPTAIGGESLFDRIELLRALP